MHTRTHHNPVDMVYTGILLQDAQVRTRVLDGEGHMVPVLCLELELDNGHHTQLHSEQHFPIGHHDQAATAAKAYKRGTRVSIQAPLIGVRLVATNTTHVQALPPIKAPQEQLCLA